MKLRSYPKYRLSGVKWLGDVPEHWEVKRLKYSTSINDEALPETTSPDYELLYVDISSVDSVTGITQKEPFIFENAPSRARRIVRDGDTIVSTVRTYLKAIASVKTPEDNLIVSTGFAVIRPVQIFPGYLSATIRAPFFIEEVVSRSVGVSYPAINASEVGFIEIPLPPLPEQQAIAAFLDRETQRIDTLVAKKKRLVELLREKRTALISHAVTRGLDPSVKLKPSGVQWLGDVPEHWEVKKVRRISTRVQTGNTPPTSEEYYYEEGTVPWFGPSSFNEKIKLENPVKFLNRLAIEEGAARLFIAGTIMVVGIGATIGKVSSIDSDASCNQQITGITFSPNVVHSEFITYQMKQLEITIRTIAPRATLAIFDQNKISDLWIALPPFSEQQAIAVYLDRETGQLDALIGKVEEAIGKLAEYRTALISAAVTGKIDITWEV